MEWLERELYEGRGTANHLEAFRHWRRNKDRDFYIDLSYRHLYRKIAAVNVALAGGNKSELASAVKQILEMCPTEQRSECAARFANRIQTRERIDFEAFNELKPLFKKVAVGEVFRVRQIAYFSMGGIAHADFATNLPNIYVTGEAMHDFGAHRVGGLPWGLYLASGRSIADTLIDRVRRGELRRVRDFNLIAQPAHFNDGILQELRRGMYKYQEDNLNAENAAGFIDWIQKTRREIISRNETIHDAFAWLVVAESVMRASLCRKESRGCFYRMDYPAESAYLSKWHTYITYDFENDEVLAELVRSSEIAQMLREGHDEEMRYVVA